MALNHTRIISKVFQHRAPFVSQIGRRFESNEITNQTGTPYRPGPMDKYFFPKSADYWLKEYPTQSAKADEYEKEEVYLDEIEERLRKYDKKYAQTDKIKNLYNEFGYEHQDDRAYHYYGGGLSGSNDELQYGRGKKLDPAQYINPDFTHITRKPIPPVEYFTAEQVRRSRGSLSNFREVPPETPSIWKYWNAYATMGVFGALLVTKEYFVLGGHDMWDAILYWSIFGIGGSIFGDWLAWWHAIISQEQYDREYFMLNDKVKKVNKQLEALAQKPNERRLLMNLTTYRDQLSEKVLQKTLSNRVARIMDSTLKKLSDKMNEEAIIRREAENSWRRDGLDNTLNYFDDKKVKNDFMKEAIKQFTQPNVASLQSSSNNVTMEDVLFKQKYDQCYNTAKNAYLKEQKSAGKLSWVFVDEKERKSKQLSKKDKETEFTKRVGAWESTHNPANAQMPAFA